MKSQTANKVMYMNKSERHKRDHLRRLKMDSAGSFGAAVCPECGGGIFYYYRFDADCCLGCNIWLSKKCADPNCMYCSRRPESPLEALFFEQSRYGGKMWRRENYAHKEWGRERKKRRKESGHGR